ncbi:hypothetical protein ASG54_22455 [Aureimonas sp. Leaf460]|nr:hypothetical protein ASG54_22455 [Aureimonas sp. Leaf460]
MKRIIQSEIEILDAVAVIDLMPHVWSPWLVNTIHRSGARYTAIAHDATPHPGDLTGYASRWADRALLKADRVFTLSDATGRQLREMGRIDPDRITTLFHPDLTYSGSALRKWHPGIPLRLLFFGRILPYKGLPLFVEAAERLRRDGMPIEIGVFGDGDLRDCRERLDQLNAEIVNRWLTEGEVAGALAAYDVVVVSHVEASQSGVVAAAFGAGMPVVATPVGALPEQVDQGITGLIAEAADGSSLANAIKRFWNDPSLYRKMSDEIARASDRRSMDAFLTLAVHSALAC